MKNKVCKIRIVAHEATNEEGVRGQSLANSNRFQHETEAHTDRDSQFQKLVSMFQTFIQFSETRQTHAPKPYQVEARDREVLIPLPEIIDNKITSEALKTWVTSVVRTTCSSAFNYFFKKEMSYEQTKIYCSENIFKNVVVLSSKYTLNAAEIELIDSHIKKGVLTYLSAKYPLTDSTEINKKLQAVIRNVDNSEALANNYFTHSKIVFEYRDSGNYNDLIMLMLNDLMGIVDSQNQEGVSSFQQFEEFMSNIFEMVEDEEWMRKHNKEHSTHHINLPHKQSEAASSSHPEIDHTKREEMAKKKERARIQTEEKEKYKSKVKEYTHYLIGRKIPESIPTFSQSEIQSRNISIKSPTILRILTKWCEQLHQKYNNNYFSNRSESVKLQRGGKIKSLLPWMRRQIDFKLEAELQLINEAMKDLFKNNYEMQTNILQHEMNLKGDEFIDQIEKVSGKLSVKVVKNLHTYIIKYLNRLIHGLLKASKQFLDEAHIFDYSSWPSPPNLLSFRIGDLMRCKCSSKQREILRIYKQLQHISRETPQKLKIIRIKNRLRSGISDILINVRFKDQITCEIQLGIKSKASDFIKCSNDFNHYLYELQRSIFGPLTELCSIWNSLDRRTNIYHELVEEQQSAAAPSHPSQHTCGKQKYKFEMKPFDKPFLCSLCNRTYHHSNYIRQHVKCNLCGYILCVYCQIDGESEEQLKKTLISSPEMRQICKGRVRKDQKLPSFGLCVFVESKDNVEELFTLVTYQKNQYLLGKRDGEIIEIFKVNTKKMAKKFMKKFVIFEVESNKKYERIGEKEAINNYILPQMMRENYKKEKQSINLMDLRLKTEQCQKILAVGSRSQKETVKNLSLTDNWIGKLPFDPLEFPSIQWLTFSRNIMKSLEGIQLLQNLKNCLCIDCKLSEIPPQFYDCPSLQQLSLSDNKITRIDHRISNLKRILSLDLSSNQLTKLTESLFECSTLTVLNMDGNQLTAIPDSIRKLSKLKAIYFSSNRLTQVTTAVGQLTNLREIYLSKNNSLSILPESLSNLHKVEMIDLSLTKICSIPSPAEGWPNVRLINIEKSLISTIPALLLGEKLEFLLMNNLRNFIFPEEGSCKSLKVLERNSGNAVGFPSFMGKMTNLTTLNYEDNDLGSVNSLPVLPNLQSLSFRSCKLVNFPRLTGFKKLKKMELSLNRFLVLPAEGMELPSLQEFACYYSNLTQLSPCMLKWERLTKLKVNYNKISSLFDQETEARVLAQGLGWPNLKSIDLDNNQLQAFPEVILNSVRIENIRLSKNKIRQIPANIKHLTQLKSITLDLNQVEVLPPEFGELPNLVKASLCQNKFTVVPKFIKDMPKLQEFLMDRMEIKTVECEEWVLSVEGVNLGNLQKTAQRLKDKRENTAAPNPDIQKMEATQYSNVNPEQYIKSP